MKKIVILLVAVACFAILASRQAKSEKAVLYLLNWGYYMDDELIVRFEEEYDCEVKEILSESNEDMYNQIINERYPIDVVIPSDYMIQKLRTANLLKPLNFDLIPNYQEDIFDDDLTSLIHEYDSSITDYAVPYFWGTVGLMYNDQTEGLEDVIKEHGYDVLFEPNLTSDSLRIGMYNNPRDSLGVAEIYLNKSLNTTSDEDLNACKDLLIEQKSKFKYVKYASDDLKSDIAGGKNLDVAVVYSGDFFDQYYVIEEEERDQYINFYAPSVTNVYFDAMVIPTTSKETDLAHDFINFFLDSEVSYQNTEYVGYCPTLKSVYEMLLEDEYWNHLLTNYQFHPTKTINNTPSNGEMYKDLGDQVYGKMDELFREIQAK